MENNSTTLPFESIVPGQEVHFDNSRLKSGLSKEEIKELAKSIKAQGLLYPLLIWKPSEGENAGKNIMIGGWRRYMALSQLIKEKEDTHNFTTATPVRYVDAPTETAARVLAFTDGLLRSNLSGYEQAREMKRLSEMGLTQKGIAQKISKSNAWVSLRLGVLEKGVEEVVNAWRDGKIPDNQVFELVKLSEEKQLEKLEEILAIREATETKPNKAAKGKAAAVTSKYADWAPKKEIGDLLKDFEVVVEKHQTNKYAQGFHEALAYVAGKIGMGEFSEEFNKLMGPINVAKTEAAMSKVEARKNALTKKNGEVAATEPTAPVTVEKKS